MRSNPSKPHQAWLDQHTDLFHSEHRDDHLAAQRLGQRQLSRAFELDDRLWIAHLQHELGALDLDRLRRPTTALWRFADAASNWRSVGELELASMAESAMELAAGGLSGREKYGWLTVSARDRRAIDALGLVSTSRVVEVGCGEGRSTLALADRVARGAVLALDRDRAASERAGSLLAGLPVNIACHGVDVLRAEPPGTLADAALAAASVEFSGDLVATFRAIATFVKPGGVISGQSNGELIPNVLDALRATGLEMQVNNAERTSPEELEQAMVAAGLEAVQVARATDFEPVGSRDELVERLAWQFSDDWTAAAKIAELAPVDHLEHRWTFFTARVPAG